MKFIELSNEIYEAIYDAVKSGYYSKEDLERPNYYEIREWVNLEYIDPQDPNYSADDKIIDDYITKVCEALKLIVDTFGIDQEL